MPKTEQPPIEDAELAKQLWAIGDATRLKILRRLPSSPDCENCCNVSQLAEYLQLSQPTVTHHLTRLRQTGLVKYKKMCRDVYYWVDAEAFAAAVAALKAVREG